ncbi:unnamed protein product [Cunninghamella blakesleeana]
MRGLYTVLATVLVLLGFTNVAESYSQNILNQWQALDKSVQSNNPNMKQIQNHWNAFATALQHEYFETTPLFAQLETITVKYDSVKQWDHLIAKTASKLNLKTSSNNKKQDTPTATQAAHENQATW